MRQETHIEMIRDDDYVAFIKNVKTRIQTAQIKAAVRVNQALLGLYWDLGERLIAKQAEARWGDGFLEQMSHDLKAEFPDMKGFSYRNLRLIRQWVSFWKSIGQQGVAPFWQQPVAKLESGFAQQLVAQIPWGHNQLIISKIEEYDEALFYVRKTLENNGSRVVLTHQIESGIGNAKSTTSPVRAS